MVTGIRDESIRKEVFEALQEGLPLATYKKTTLGRIRVKILDPIRLLDEELILVGDPDLNDELGQVRVWSLAEDKYLKRNNKFHFNNGSLVQCSAAQEEAFQVNQITDEEIESILQQPFYSLKNKLGTFTSTIPVRRFLLAAEKLNRPVRTIEFIKEKLANMEQKIDPAKEA